MGPSAPQRWLHHDQGGPASGALSVAKHDPYVGGLDGVDCTVTNNKDECPELDRQYQDHILPHVSRTFALTIPQLPADLRDVVANGYLLCRIADTIEDEVSLPPHQRQYFHDRFARAVAGDGSPEGFVQELTPQLSEDTPPSERDLVLNTPSVVRMTHRFNASQRAALERCVGIMSEGMARFQRHGRREGLRDVDVLGQYCYHVAGVVGEMLTDLFCIHSPLIAEHRERLRDLSVSFGQGLQMTNILKDMWDDQQRGACWLPQDVFHGAGVDLAHLGSVPPREPGFNQALDRLIGMGHMHLREALEYTLLIPAHEVGIRRFCLWAIGLALLTLRNIHHNPEFTSGAEVKVSRRALRATIITTNVATRHDALLRWLFHVWGRDLPAVPGSSGLPPRAAAGAPR